MMVTSLLCIALYMHYYPEESKHSLEGKDDCGNPSFDDDDEGIERITDEEYLQQ